MKKTNILAIIADICFLLLVLLLSGLSIVVMLRAEKPLSYVSLLSIFVVSVFSVILYYWGRLREKPKKLMGFFNRLIFLWILLEAIFLLPSWLESTVMPPWNQNLWDSSTSLLLIESSIKTNFLQTFWCFFVGTILALATPFITSLILCVTKSLYHTIVSPLGKKCKSPASSKLVISSKNSVPDLNMLTFMKFLRRSLFFFVFTAPIVFTLAGVKIEWGDTGLKMSPGVVYFVTITFIPLLVGVGYFLENASIKASTDSKKEISEMYFETLMKISLLAGIFSVATILSRILAESLSIDLLMYYAVGFYLPLIATSLPIFVILSERRMAKRLFNLPHSWVIGCVFIVLFTIWFLATQEFTYPLPFFTIIQPFYWFPIPMSNPYWLVILSCFWMFVPLIQYLMKEPTRISWFSIAWRIILSFLIVAPVVFLPIESPFVSGTEFWRNVVFTFYVVMILASI